MVEALYELIQEGECKREDFILQTKIPAGDEKAFMKFWTQSWDNVEDKLGYIDLLSLHALADVDEKLDVSLRLAEGFKKEGKVRHIGFSTHGTSEQIMACINTERVSFVFNILCWNLHLRFHLKIHMKMMALMVDLEYYLSIDLLCCSSHFPFSSNTSICTNTSLDPTMEPEHPIRRGDTGTLHASNVHKSWIWGSFKYHPLTREESSTGPLVTLPLSLARKK